MYVIQERDSPEFIWRSIKSEIFVCHPLAILNDVRMFYLALIFSPNGLTIDNSDWEAEI